jgi:uncharacterized protein YegL
MVAVGGKLSKRPLHFFFLCDCSGSMSVDGKIEALNSAIREAIPAMKEAAKANPEATVYVRAIRFANEAEWHISEETPVDQFVWTDLTADGVTVMGKAMELLADKFKGMEQLRALRPVIVLISDGEPTDDFTKGLDKLNAGPWGQKAVRIAIAIGSKANKQCLQEFTRDQTMVLEAKNAAQLTDYIKWVSTALVNVVSKVTPNIPGTGKEPGRVSDDGEVGDPDNEPGGPPVVFIPEIPQGVIVWEQ